MRSLIYKVQSVHTDSPLEQEIVSDQSLRITQSTVQNMFNTIHCITLYTHTLRNYANKTVISVF